MFKKLLTIILVAVVAFGAFGSFSTARASARTANWVVSVTYQNVGQNATPVTVFFYEEGSNTATTFDPLNGGTLPAGAGASFFIGSVSGLTSGFRGNAVIESNEPLVATSVQFSQDAGFNMRLLTNAFQAGDASEQFLIATVLLNKFNRTTVFSIQNTGSTDVTATVNFYDADNNGALANSIQHTIPAASSKYIEMDNVADTGLTGRTVFNGSAIVTVPAGQAIVASANEFYTNSNVAGAFEGIPLSRVANTIYMATALCQKFGLDTYYAVQNASLTASANVTVTYRNLDGSTKATDGPYPIGPGQKKSITTCAPSNGANMAGFTGSAVVSTGAGEAPVAVIGKAQCSQATGACNAGSTYQNVFTIFLGEPAGSSKIALPFVRWASDANFTSPSNTGGKQRAALAIQNLGSAEIKVDVKYYDKVGTNVATQTLTIAPFSKGNSDANVAGALGKGGMNPGEFGYYTDGSFGGSVVIQANSATPSAQFIAIARVQNPGAGEDYNAVAVP